MLMFPLVKGAGGPFAGCGGRREQGVPARDIRMDFTSSVDHVDEVTRRIKVTIPADKIRREMDDSLGKLTRTSSVKGFRPGKAPRPIIERMYGDNVRYDVAHKLINSSLSQVAKEQALEIIGAPEVDITSFDAGKDLEFTAQVSLFPSPQVTQYQGIKVQVQRSVVADAEVQEVIERLRGSKATMKKIEGRTVARSGDVVDLTIAAEIEGKAGERPEPFVVGLGEKKLPEDLEKGIEGMEIGASKSIPAVMPAGRAAQSTEPKSAVYQVTLNALFEKILPELDDAFVKGLGLGSETVLELRLKVRKELEDERAREAKSDAQAAVLDALVQAHDFKVPQVLIDDEIRALLVRYRIMDAKKAESADVEPFRKELGEAALKRVKSAILIDRIGEAEKIKAEKDDIEKEIEELAAQSGVSVDEARKYIMNRERLVSFLMEITRNKVIGFLVEHAQIEYVEKAPEAAA